MCESKVRDEAMVKVRKSTDRPGGLDCIIPASTMSTMRSSESIKVLDFTSFPRAPLSNTPTPLLLAAGAPAVDKTSNSAVLWERIDAIRLEIGQRKKTKVELRVQMRKILDDNFAAMVARTISGNMSPQTLRADLNKIWKDGQSDYNFSEAEYEALEKEVDQLEAQKYATEIRLFELPQFLCPGGCVFLNAVADGGRATEQVGNAPIPTDESNRGLDRPEKVADGQNFYPGKAPYFKLNNRAPLSDPSLLGISGDRPSDIHPLYGELIHAIGERQMTEDSLSELTLEHDIILDKLQTKLLLEHSHKGYPILSEEELADLKATLANKSPAFVADKYSSLLVAQDAAFLRQFDSSKKARLRELSRHKKRADDLRKECSETGVMRKNMPGSEEYAIFGQSGGVENDDLVEDAMTDAPPRGTMDPDGLSNPFFPILLSSPKHLLEVEPLTAKDALRRALALPAEYPMRELLVQEKIKEYGISTTLTRFKEGHKVDFINRWLLQRLRISPLEAELLYSLFTMSLKVLNSAQWQKDVLHFWTEDGIQPLPEPMTVDESTPSETRKPDDTPGIDSNCHFVPPLEKQTANPIVDEGRRQKWPHIPSINAV